MGDEEPDAGEWYVIQLVWAMERMVQMLAARKSQRERP